MWSDYWMSYIVKVGASLSNLSLDNHCQETCFQTNRSVRAMLWTSFSGQEWFCILKNNINGFIKTLYFNFTKKLVTNLFGRVWAINWMRFGRWGAKGRGWGITVWVRVRVRLLGAFITQPFSGFLWNRREQSTSQCIYHQRNNIFWIIRSKENMLGNYIVLSATYCKYPFSKLNATLSSVCQDGNTAVGTLEIKCSNFVR